MNHETEAPASFEFGRFKILPQHRDVLADGRPLRLGGRAFDVLVVLVEANGAVVGKDELIRRVWPRRIVAENNLHAQIRALRRAFSGQDVIRTVVGRGYQFRGELRIPGASREAPTRPASGSDIHHLMPARTNLPVRMSDLIGRGGEIAAIMGLVTDHRLVTLTGLGGIGKTRLAIEVARQLEPRFADGVWIAELAPLTDAGLVPATVAAALGLELASGVISPARVAEALGPKHLLLVLDNCEHVIDAAAAMVEALVRANPAACVIATSREPLRAESERVYPVPPLDVPGEDTLAMEDVLRHSAVALFFARAQAADPAFAADRGAAAVISSICRHLDGIPLAIELAAARAASLGVQPLASRLDDRFTFLTGGRRTALERHQTLRAAFDWSYELLSERDRSILRRLSIFAGSFSLGAASAVVASDELPASEAVDGLADLATKSLIIADVSSPLVRYRLLETTRAYAIEKLAQAGEFAQAARRHAEFYRDLCAQAAAEWQTRSATEWQADYGTQIGNVRAALDWCFSPQGDVAIGGALTAAAVPLWCQLSLLDECRARVEQALTQIAAELDRDATVEMQLEAAMGLTLFHTKGSTREAGDAWARALAIADRLKNAEYQLRALWGLWSYRMTCAEYPVALAHAKRFSRLAAKQSDSGDRLIADRMIGTVLRYTGDLTDARRHLERMLDRYVDPLHRSHTIRFVWDQRVAGEMALAVVLWLQGFPDQAMRTARHTVESAQARDHAISLCYALTSAACPIALQVGDLDAAEVYVSMLLDHSTKLAMRMWQAEGRCLQGALWLKRSRIGEGLELLRSALDQLHETGCILRYAGFLGLFAEGLAVAGEVSAGRAAIDEALTRSENNGERWFAAELLRIKGELVLLENRADAALTAEDLFREAIDLAHQQRALSWELRVAISLARMLRDRGRSNAARQILAPVYARFTEGYNTVDLKIAKALIEQC